MDCCKAPRARQWWQCLDSNTNNCESTAIQLHDTPKRERGILMNLIPKLEQQQMYIQINNGFKHKSVRYTCPGRTASRCDAVSNCNFSWLLLVLGIRPSPTSMSSHEASAVSTVKTRRLPDHRKVDGIRNKKIDFKTTANCKNLSRQKNLETRMRRKIYLRLQRPLTRSWILQVNCWWADIA